MSVLLLVVPLSVAEMVTTVVAVTTDVLTGTGAEVVIPAATVTLVCTVAAALLLERLTTSPPL